MMEIVQRTCVEAATPRDADDPAMMRQPGARRHGAAVVSGSPVAQHLEVLRTCVEAAAPRDAYDPATTGNKQTAARRHGAAVDTRSPVAQQLQESVRENVGGQAPPQKKKARTASASGLRMATPTPWFEPESYGENLWTEVAKHLSGSDIIHLSSVCRWLLSTVMDDSIWRYASLRELQLLDNFTSKKQLDNYWRRIYIANELHTLCRQNNEFSSRGFVMGATDLILTASLPTSFLSLNHAVESMGICVLTNVHHGAWIISAEVRKCPGCAVAGCEGSVQILEARHCELLVDSSWEDNMVLEDLGQYLVDNQVDKAFCGIFNSEYLDSPSTAVVVNTSCWIGQKKDLLTTSWKSPYAAAINTNVQFNQGLLSKFEAVRDKRNGKIVCARIIQTLRDTQHEA